MWTNVRQLQRPPLQFRQRVQLRDDAFELPAAASQMRRQPSQNIQPHRQLTTLRELLQQPQPAVGLQGRQGNDEAGSEARREPFSQARGTLRQLPRTTARGYQRRQMMPLPLVKQLHHCLGGA